MVRYMAKVTFVLIISREWYKYVLMRHKPHLRNHRSELWLPFLASFTSLLLTIICVHSKSRCQHSMKAVQHSGQTWAQYLSPQLMSAGPAARAAEGRGRCNDPCFSALTERGKRSRRESTWVQSCKEDNYIYPRLCILMIPAKTSDRKGRNNNTGCECKLRSVCPRQIIYLNALLLLNCSHCKYNYTVSLKCICPDVLITSIVLV